MSFVVSCRLCRHFGPQLWHVWIVWWGVGVFVKWRTVRPNTLETMLKTKLQPMLAMTLRLNFLIATPIRNIELRTINQLLVSTPERLSSHSHVGRTASSLATGISPPDFSCQKMWREWKPNSLHRLTHYYFMLYKFLWTFIVRPRLYLFSVLYLFLLHITCKTIWCLCGSTAFLFFFFLHGLKLIIIINN